jgi:hypothetical protein
MARFFFGLYGGLTVILSIIALGVSILFQGFGHAQQVYYTSETILWIFALISYGTYVFYAIWPPRRYVTIVCSYLIIFFPFFRSILNISSFFEFIELLIGPVLWMYIMYAQVKCLNHGKCPKCEFVVNFGDVKCKQCKHKFYYREIKKLKKFIIEQS